jgi:AraC-like DNA-binding protein
MAQIVYKEFQPDRALAPFIDAFWTIAGNNSSPQPDKILPDGCVDIILNTGPAFHSRQATASNSQPGPEYSLMNSGEAYLVGTMTRYIEMVRPPSTSLTGIRFKPGGFSFFYDPGFLKDAANRTVGFDRALVPILHPDHSDPSPVLNRFFTSRLSIPKQPVLPLIADIQRLKGKLTITQLARRNFITIRHLERLFQHHLDLTPKAFINFVRYQAAMVHIQSKPAPRTLLDIALECGYYDHAHLANEIKKYSGLAPTGI